MIEVVEEVYINKDNANEIHVDKDNVDEVYDDKVIVE